MRFESHRTSRLHRAFWATKWSRGTKNAHEFFWHSLFEQPQGFGTSRQNSGTFQIPLFETQGRQISREGTNFSGTTPSRGRPPPHWAVSGLKRLIFVFFCFCLMFVRGGNLNNWGRVRTGCNNEFYVFSAGAPHWILYKLGDLHKDLMRNELLQLGCARPRFYRVFVPHFLRVFDTMAPLWRGWAL